MDTDQVTENPARGREPRKDVTTRERRRRNGGTLNRMAQFRLDCIPAEALDLENYVYRWIDDKPGRLRMATQMDDYDFVNTGEIGPGFNPENTDSESTERVRMFAETNGKGDPVFTYLCKKPRAFWEEDNEEIVRKREDMMAGRIYRAEATDDDGRDLEERNAYVPAGVQMGGPAQRKRGPVPRNFK